MYTWRMVTYIVRMSNKYQQEFRPSLCSDEELAKTAVTCSSRCNDNIIKNKKMNGGYWMINVCDDNDGDNEAHTVGGGSDCGSVRMTNILVSCQLLLEQIGILLLRR